MQTTIINPNLVNVARNIDPVSDIEQVLNKTHEQFDDSEKELMLFHGLASNRSKNALLKSLGDTHFGITWSDFKDLIRANGFIPALEYPFVYETNYFGEVNRANEEAILYYHPEKGLAIFATSYNDATTLNSGKLYGQVRYSTPLERQVVKGLRPNTTYTDIVKTPELLEAVASLNGCSHDAYSNIDKGIAFNFDAREGLINKIHEIGEKLEFCKIWVKSDFLWFVDYKEEKESDYNHEEISLRKIAQSPAEFQQIVDVYVQSKKK